MSSGCKQTQMPPARGGRSVYTRHATYDLRASCFVLFAIVARP